MQNKWIGLALVFLVFAASPLWGEEDGIPRFDIDRFAVEGNTLLPEAEIAAALQKFTGRGKDFGDVEEALEVLEGLYRKAGYNAVAVLLPEQELNEGTVQLKVVEGKVSSFVVEGNHFHDQENILQAFPALKIGTTPQVEKLSKDLYVSNENASKKVALQMISGEREDEIIASLQVTDQRPWNLALMADNSGTGQTGDYRVSFMYQHHNLFNLDHGLTLVYNTSPGYLDKVNVFNMLYHLPVYRAGDSIDLVAGYSGVDSGAVQFSTYDLQVSGKGLVSGIKYNKNLDRIKDYQHKVALGFDYKEFDNSLTLLGTDLGNKILVHPLSLTYSGTLGLKGGELGFYLSGSHNDPWGSRGEQEDFDRQNNANGDYTIARFGANVGYALPKEYQFKLNGSGQYTRDILIPGEQFGLGGAGSLRGFKDRAIAGDCGFGGSAELYSPNLAAKLGAGEAQLRMVGFFDAGTAYPSASAPPSTAPDTISSIGAGFRLGWSTKVSCSLDWGYVLQPSANGNQGDTAVHLKTMVLY